MNMHTKQTSRTVRTTPITISTTCQMDSPFSVAFSVSKWEGSIPEPSLSVGRTALRPAKSSCPLLIWLPPWAPSHMRSPNSWDSNTAVLESTMTLWSMTSEHCSIIRNTQQKQNTFPSGRNGYVGVDGPRLSRQRDPGWGLHPAQCQYHSSRGISPSNRCFAVSSRSVGLLFWMNTLALWRTVTIRRNGFIGYTLESGLQCNGWRCENVSLHSFYISLEAHRMVRRYDTTRLWGSTQSRKERVRPKVGKDRMSMFVVWPDEMKMRCCLSTPGSLESILPVSQSTSVTPVSPYTHCRYFTIFLEAMIELVWRCTSRPVWFELRDALGGCDRASLDINLEAEIDMNSERCSEAVTVRVWRCTCRLRSSEIGGVLGATRFGGRCNRSWDSIHWFTCNCGNVESWVQHPERDEKLAGSGRLLIMGCCCTWCML